MTHWPYIASEHHGIGHTASDLRRPKVEAVVSDVPCGVGSQGTPVLVAITTRSLCSEAELEAVVTLAVGTPPRVAVTGGRSIAARAVCHLVPGVGVAVSSHREGVGGLGGVRLREGGREIVSYHNVYIIYGHAKRAQIFG